MLDKTSNAKDSKDLPDKKFELLLGMTTPDTETPFQNFVDRRNCSKFGFDWTLVRVAGLNNKARSNDVKLGYLGQGRLSFTTSRADMADFLLQQVTDST